MLGAFGACWGYFGPCSTIWAAYGGPKIKGSLLLKIDRTKEPPSLAHHKLPRLSNMAQNRPNKIPIVMIWELRHLCGQFAAWFWRMSGSCAIYVPKSFFNWRNSFYVPAKIAPFSFSLSHRAVPPYGYFGFWVEPSTFRSMHMDLNRQMWIPERCHLVRSEQGNPVPVFFHVMEVYCMEPPISVVNSVLCYKPHV